MELVTFQRSKQIRGKYLRLQSSDLKVLDASKERGTLYFVPNTWNNRDLKSQYSYLQEWVTGNIVPESS